MGGQTETGSRSSGRGSWVGGGRRGGRPRCQLDEVRRGDEVGERGRVEDAADRVADADPENVDGAGADADARLRVGGVLAGTDHGREGTLEGAQRLGRRDLGRVSGQRVAAAGAAGRVDEPGLAERDDELLEVGPRQVLLGGDVRQAHGHGRLAGPTAGQLDEHPDAVLALRAEGDGAGGVEGADAQGGILVECGPGGPGAAGPVAVGAAGAERAEGDAPGDGEPPQFRPFRSEILHRPAGNGQREAPRSCHVDSTA